MNIWYSIFHRKAYSGNAPAFYPSNAVEWAEVLENNWVEINNELVAHLAENPRLVLQNKKQKVNNHGAWKTMPLMTWGVEFHKNIGNFPVTMNVLKQLPGLASASFNLLEKQSEIKPHFGETNASVRVHLGLSIPDDHLAIGFKVKDVSHSWEEGKVLIFCDAYEHSGWNRSNQDRYILLLDVLRPEFLHRKRWICGNVLATLSLQSIVSKSAIWFYLTFVPLVILHFFSAISAILLTPLYNSLSKMRASKMR